MIDHLDALESRSIFILRRPIADRQARPAVVDRGFGMCWSGLPARLLLGVCQVPVIHVDTSYKLPEYDRVRDRMAQEWGLDLIIGQNRAALTPA